LHINSSKIGEGLKAGNKLEPWGSLELVPIGVGEFKTYL
jgi:hypothetical protein